MGTYHSASHRGVIPDFRTRLIGREAERAASRAFLLEDAVPLLTLTGPGGVGKTRLSLAIAQDLAGNFADGVVWVDLSPINDPRLVPAAIAASLGLVQATNAGLVETLAHHLHHQQTLLVLDNCEHVLDETADVVARLVARCAALQVLATSRAPLQVRGEQRLPVEPLSLPDVDASLAAISESASVRLFTARARAVRPSFRIETANAATLALVCHHLDGLPLAIELAAAHSMVLSPAALLAQMTDRLRLLAGGPRDGPLRQQTMGAAIAWSYDRLGAVEKAAFRRLAVFAGGWTLPAAAAVLDRDDGETLALLEHLVAHSLVRVVESRDAPRFTFLETIHDYAREQLRHHGEEIVARDAHAAHYVDEAEQADAEIETFDMAGGLGRLEAERANIRAAFAYFRLIADDEGAARLAIASHKLWQFRGPLAEWLTNASETLARLDPGSSPSAFKLRYLVSMLRWVAGEGELAFAGFALCLDQARSMGNTELIVMILNQQAILYGWDHRDWERAIPLAQEAVALARAHNLYVPFPLANLGVMLTLAGDPVQGIPLIDEAITIDRTAGDDYGLGVRLMHRGLAAHETGDLPGAARWWDESLQRLWSCHDEMHMVGALSGLASLASHYQPPQAARLLGMAYAIRDRTGSGSRGGPTALFHPLREAAHLRARDALGEAAFAAAYNAGYVTPLAKAVDEAHMVGAAYASASALEEIAARPWSAPPVHRALTANDHSNGFGLTRREREILTLLCQRLTDPEIAAQLYLSPRTVSKHVSNILGKLGVISRREVSAVAVRHNLA
jgi:predicted ATPase/DNA-binding CsgD family transcriptional regulator